MARPDGEDLAAELERLQARIEEIQQELANPPEPEPPPAAERAAKRWGLKLVVPIVGAAAWALTRPREHYVAALGVATTATGVTSGVLLLPDTQPMPHQGQPPAAIETTTAQQTVTTRERATTTEPRATQPEVTSIPQPANPQSARPTTEPTSRTTEATRTTAPSTTQEDARNPGRQQPPGRGRGDMPPTGPPDSRPPGNDERPSRTAPPGIDRGKSHAQCGGVHVDVPRIAEICLLG